MIATAGTRVLILSASIGEGHDLPARAIAAGITAREPAAEVRIADFLEIVSPLIRRIVVEGSQFDSELGSRIYDVEHKLLTEIAPTRRLCQLGIWHLGHRRMARAIGEFRPDAIVSTYPAATELLGAMRERGALRVPVASAITDLASLRMWARLGVDLHMIVHPESRAEVGSIAPGTRIVAARGMTEPSHYDPVDPADARRALELPVEGPLVTVSGGGWAVGDLGGAVDESLRAGAFVVCVCGRNDEARLELKTRLAGNGRVRVIGFTERMAELLAASDVLIHSTAGLTVLEAIMRGTRVISYGWGHAHIRINNRAYRRFGLAEVAGSRDELGPAVARALAAPRRADGAFARLPDAADLVLELAQPETSHGTHAGFAPKGAHPSPAG